MAAIRRLLPLVLLFFAATAFADELRWRSLDVTATIDDGGIAVRRREGAIVLHQPPASTSTWKPLTAPS
jgi:hypothetical protein